MARIFSFALGNIWRWSKNRASLLKYAKKLDISGVEITFATSKELFDFKLSNSDKNWLKKLDYVTIHAPFFDFAINKDENQIKIRLDCIYKLYKEINAKNVIIHPDQLPLKNLLKNYDFNISTENLESRTHIRISDLKKVFAKYPKIGLCLDVSHAYTFDKKETEELIKEFKNRITQIHFSGTYGKKRHQSLRIVTKDFLQSIEGIKKLNVPIVIEEDIEVKSVKYLKEEIAYIKKLLV